MARVIITMEGGLIQHIMADQEGVEVMVLDFDTEGGDDERIREFEGNLVLSSTGWTLWTRSGSMKSKQPSLSKIFILSLSTGRRSASCFDEPLKKRLDNTP